MKEHPNAVAVPSAYEAAFDFVVVGGGSAGATLAGRLTEDPAVSVAVIEAGKAGDFLHERVGEILDACAGLTEEQLHRRFDLGDGPGELTLAERTSQMFVSRDGQMLIAFSAGAASSVWP